ncbi:MAG: UvrD-helicase domain-containing protein [Gammaproteobacteria bacterium]|nr:UvrD-helicase domain-containing protein [Gammaproteobacteria bacterium]
MNAPEASRADLDQRPAPVDEDQRQRVRAELRTSFLVEAGAGSGKTTLLVDRMVALVESGEAEVARIAAVTFTRKAAAELRERFQVALERRYREARPDPAEGERAARLRDAIDGIDRAFLGTIHAFCARLLRERPIEAGLDPEFQEAQEAETQLLQERFWTSFVERIISDSDPLVEELARVGLRVDQLRKAFDQMVENLDLEYPADPVAAPGPEEARGVRRVLEKLLDRALALIPDDEPERGWDATQQMVRSLRYTRRFRGWDDLAALFDAAEKMSSGKGFTLNRWPQPTPEGSAEVKRLRDELAVLGSEDGPIRKHLDRWLAHRYSMAIRLVRRAALEFAEERLRIGLLSFHDLLMLTAQLLREHPEVRRDLGERYRYVLIDEFQDTDPIQAELLFLLASEPEPQAGDAGRRPADWHTVVPRPGALFVVGDPKQSIYRFRRADIAVYNQVRTRFREFGAVLRLITNFRSRQTVADLVNDIFDDPARFPREETDRQACFAPMVPYPRAPNGPEGVFHYHVPKARRNADAARLEAAMLASWIRARLDSGERTAGDFLVLTRKKAHLDAYARALEERNVTIEVSGAQAGPEEELRELVLLLETLIDPGNPVNVVAVLTGLFFGLDHEQLAQHALAGGRFDFTSRSRDRDGDVSPRDEDISPRDASATEVVEAIATLHEWWKESRREPADIVIGRLVDRLGLMPFVASSTLGTLRAGIMAYALDSVRAEALRGNASLAGAVEALQAALEWEDAEAPFDPGHGDAVRVMNLHKAKGLQATVVVLANPAQTVSHTRRLHAHTRRGARGGAEAFAAVTAPAGPFSSWTLAQPLEWAALAQEEVRFLEAEEQRILYVACTRAREELVVARKHGKSCWGIFDGWLDRHAKVLQLAADVPQSRERMARSAEDLLAETEAAETGMAEGARPSYEFASITELAKGGEGEVGEAAVPDTAEARGEDAAAQPGRTDGPGTPDDPATPPAPDRTTLRGYAWGSAVHGTLAAAAQGVEGEALEFVARALLVEHERPLDERGAPAELDELMSLVGRVRASELWRRAERTDMRQPEVPFAVERPAENGGIPRLVEGVIDLAFREADGWVIVDYKTDVGDDPDFPRRRRAYRRQVDLYAECWERVTGEPVKEKALLFTTMEEEERW